MDNYTTYRLAACALIVALLVIGSNVGNAQAQGQLQITCTASSAYSGYPASYACDGDNNTVWYSSQGSGGAGWLLATLSGGQAYVDPVVLRDDPSLTYNTTAGYLSFSDGSEVAFPSPLPTNGTPLEILFAPRLTSFVQVNVTGSQGNYAVLAEIAVYAADVTPTPLPTETPTPQATAFVWPESSCPSGSLERGPSPYGTSPHSLKFCDMTSTAWQLFNDNAYPCGEGIAYHQPTYVGSNEYKLAIVPPANMDFPGNTAVFQFYVAGNGAFGPVTDNIILRIRAYNVFGGQVGETMQVSGNNFTRHQQGNGVTWQITGLPIPALQGGHWTVTVWEPLFLLGWGSIYISSLAIYPLGGTQPTMCPLPLLTPTPTPHNQPTQTPLPQTSPTPGQTPGTATPGPSPTSQGTATPTAGPGTATITPQSTSTPWPTSPGGTPVTGTPQPAATIPVQMPTPLPGVTWPAPNLPSIQFPLPDVPTVTPVSQQINPWPVPSFPTVDFNVPTARAWVLTDTTGISGTIPVILPPGPGITVPGLITYSVGLTPNPTIEAAAYVISGTVGDVRIAATRWHTMTTGGAILLVEGGTGIGSVGAAMQEFTLNLSLPFRYLKSMQSWFPNIWPFIVFLLVTFGWINFVYIGKFGVQNGGKFIEIFRRLVDLVAQLIQMGPTALIILLVVIIVGLLAGSLMISSAVLGG